MRLAIAALSLALVATAAEAAVKAGPNVIGRHHRLGPGSGGTVLAGAGLDYNFQTGQYFQAGAAPGVTVTRASGKSCDDQAGNYTTVAGNVLCSTNKGALIEEARTNGIRNNSMQGAVPGTPGTLPTNWSISGVPAGVTTTINSVGVQGGVDVISITFSGTNNSGSSAFIAIPYEAGNFTAALQNQVWTASHFMSMSGPVQTLSWGLRIAEVNNVGAFLTQSALLSSIGFGAPFARQSGTYTLTNAATAFTYAVASANALANGAAINQTITIGWPQLELGSFATSPIRTTNAAATRAADVVTVTTPPAFGSAYTLFAQGAPVAPVAYANNQWLGGVDDGSNANRFALFRVSGTGAAQAIWTSAGVGNSTGTRVLNSGVSSKFAAAGAASDQAGSVNGQAVETQAQAGAITPTRVIIGLQANGLFPFNGYIERIALWPTSRLSNANLQSLTQ